MISLVEAIARMEGFEVDRSRAQRNNNPGNLNFGDFARKHGATDKDNMGFAVFPTAEHGWNALKALLREPPYKGMSLTHAIEKYCPPEGDARGRNNTDRYIALVSQWTGIGMLEVIDRHLVDT